MLIQSMASLKETPDEAPPGPKSGAKPGRTRQEWMKDPAVRKTLDMFDGDIADIRE